MTEAAAADRNPIIAAVASKWWVLLIRGILLIVLGIYAFTAPAQTLGAFVWVFGIFLVADGVLAIVGAMSGWSESRGATILRGLLMILVGAAAIASPLLFGATVGTILIYVIAVAFIVGGMLEIATAIKERKAIEGEGTMILAGVVAILFGLALATAPLFSIKIVVMVWGVIALVYGFAAIFVAFKMKSLNARLEGAH